MFTYIVVCSLVRFIALCSLCMYVLYIRKYKLFFIVKKEQISYIRTTTARRKIRVIFIYIFFYTKTFPLFFNMFLKYENSFGWVVLFKITLNFFLDINELTKK